MKITDPSPYDSAIQAAMGTCIPQWDWRWLKAQLFQESTLDPSAHNARSGAAGIAQFMPATWADMLKSVPTLRYDATPYDAPEAIKAAAWYMAKLRATWRTDRPESDRRQLAQASYNAGIGNLIKAQQYAGGARSYASIVAYLPDVTGDDNARETTDYVAKIQHWYDALTLHTGAA